MATLSEKITAVNTLGKTNLSKKGITVPENATTYEIMQCIAEIVIGGNNSGDGGNNGNNNNNFQYDSIVYNDDNTITLISTDGTEHIMECEYENGKLVSVTYDGASISLTYQDDTLVFVGHTRVDFENVPSSSGSGGTEELENLIDESGVLDNTEGTVTEKVGQLIELARTGGDNCINTTILSRFGVSDLNLFNKPKVELNLPLVSNYYRLLKQTTQNTTVEHIIINGLQEPVIDEMIETFCAVDDYTLKRITLNLNSSKVDDFSYCFYHLQALEVIDGTPIDFSSVIKNGIDYAFTNCFALREISVKPSSIKQPIYFSQSANLSAKSIQSIIDGLATVTTDKTLTLHKNVVLSDEQKATINAKGWTLVQ